MWQDIHVIAIAKGTRGHEQRPARDFGGIRHQNVARYGDNCLQTTIECQDLLTLSNGFDLRQPAVVATLIPATSPVVRASSFGKPVSPCVAPQIASFRANIADIPISIIFK
jgi:hypothetical protein